MGALQFSAPLGTILAGLAPDNPTGPLPPLDPTILAGLSGHDDDVRMWANGQPNIQAGVGQGVWAAATVLVVTVTFPAPFPANPVVTVTPGVVAPVPPTAALATVTTTGFTVQFNTPGVMGAGVVQVFTWSAIGAQT